MLHSRIFLMLRALLTVVRAMGVAVADSDVGRLVWGGFPAVGDSGPHNPGPITIIYFFVFMMESAGRASCLLFLNRNRSLKCCSFLRHMKPPPNCST